MSARNSRSLVVLKWGVVAALALPLSIAGCPGPVPSGDGSTPPTEPPVGSAWPQAGAATSYGVPLALDNAARFIEYYTTYKLSAEQRSIRNAGLTMPAPCCDDYPMSTCCCPCNLAQSVWGLAAWLISEKGYDAAAVEAAALQWLQFVRPDYYRAVELENQGLNPRDYGLVRENSCYVGKCELPFSQGGCGGMGALNLGE